MGKTRPCSVCQTMTSRLLFRDKKLDVAICSKPCEYEFIRRASSDPDMQVSMVRYFEDKVKQTKRHENECWAIAGFGLLMLACGFFLQNVDLFIIGILPITLGTLFTRHFEEKETS